MRACIQCAAPALPPVGGDDEQPLCAECSLALCRASLPELAKRPRVLRQIVTLIQGHQAEEQMGQ